MFQCPHCGHGAFRVLSGTPDAVECLSCGKPSLFKVHLEPVPVEQETRSDPADALAPPPAVTTT